MPTVGGLKLSFIQTSSFFLDSPLNGLWQVSPEQYLGCGEDWACQNMLFLWRWCLWMSEQPLLWLIPHHPPLASLLLSTSTSISPRSHTFCCCCRETKIRLDKYYTFCTSSALKGGDKFSLISSSKQKNRQIVQPEWDEKWKWNTKGSHRPAKYPPKKTVIYENINAV